MDYALSECFQFQVTENGTEINLNKKRLTDSGLKKKKNHRGRALSFELIFVLSKTSFMENIAFLQDISLHSFKPLGARASPALLGDEGGDTSKKLITTTQYDKH